MALIEETRILIADSQPVFRRGIVETLAQEADFEVTGEANDGDMAVAIALQTSPNVIVVEFVAATQGRHRCQYATEARAAIRRRDCRCRQRG